MSQENTGMTRQELVLLGEIHGLVKGLRDGQAAQAASLAEMNNRMAAMDTALGERIDGVETRLRDVEKVSAVAGSLSGGAVAIGVALIVEGLRHWITRTPGQ